MAFQNITAAGNVIVNNRVNTMLIQVNTGFTGTITVTAPARDVNNLVSTRPVAIITNPVSGQAFRYWDMPFGFTVAMSATGDVTVNWQGNRQAS